MSMVMVETKVTSEGISMSAYTDDGRALLDESWYTWDEIEGMKEDGPDGSAYLSMNV